MGQLEEVLDQQITKALELVPRERSFEGLVPEEDLLNLYNLE
jgi:hypothetical protein